MPENFEIKATQKNEELTNTEFELSNTEESQKDLEKKMEEQGVFEQLQSDLKNVRDNAGLENYVKELFDGDTEKGDEFNVYSNGVHIDINDAELRISTDIQNTGLLVDMLINKGEDIVKENLIDEAELEEGVSPDQELQKKLDAIDIANAKITIEKNPQDTNTGNTEKVSFWDDPATWISTQITKFTNFAQELPKKLKELTDQIPSIAEAFTSIGPAFKDAMSAVSGAVKQGASTLSETVEKNKK